MYTDLKDFIRTSIFSLISFADFKLTAIKSN